MLIKRLGLNFLLGSVSENVDFLVKKIQSQASLLVLPCSLNDLAHADKSEYRAAYRVIDYCCTDGMPLVWYFQQQKKRGKIKNIKIERTYGPDLMKFLLTLTSQKRHFFCGSNQTTLNQLKQKLLKINPNLKTMRFYSPPFSNDLNYSQALIKKLQRQKSDILWIALPSPKQVLLASIIKKACPNLKIFCVGAAIDFLAKTKKQAPIIWQKLGLEWLYRLLQEPKRLAKRYLLDIPFFLIKKCWQKLLASDF